MASGDTKTGQLLDILENGGDISKIVGCCNTSLQNYLIESIEYVQDAKEKIVEKGGVVDDSGLAELANEIDTIPTGGGGGNDWGYIIVDLDGTPRQLTIQNAYELHTLSNVTSGIVEGEAVTIANITEVHLGKSVIYLPDSFLAISSGTISKLSKIDGLENVRIIGDYFLRYQTSFNADLNLSNVVYIGESFMAVCSAFNSDISLSDELSYIGSNFLSGCTLFNQDLVISVSHIPQNFLYGCTAFNSNIDFTSPELAIDHSFLYNCTSFNKPLDLAGVTSIAGSFLRGCTSFNQPIDLAGITSIGDNFLNGCSSFAQDLVIPETVLTIPTGSSGYFMYNCNSFTGTLTCETSAHPSGNYSLSTTDSTAPMYVTGITLAGAYASTWKSAMSNRNSSPYRKLVVS